MTSNLHIRNGEVSVPFLGDGQIKKSFGNSPAEVDESKFDQSMIKELMELTGQPKEGVVQALQMCEGNKEQAANLLMSEKWEPCINQIFPPQIIIFLGSLEMQQEKASRKMGNSDGRLKLWLMLNDKNKKIEEILNIFIWICFITDSQFFIWKPSTAQRFDLSQ